MKNRMWINLVMAILVAGLFFTVSCAKKTIVSDATAVQDQTSDADSDAAAKAAADAKAEAERIAQQDLEDQMANEKALEMSKAMAAEKRFVNQDIHFKYDSSELTAMAKMLLKEKASWLNENYSVTVSIEGHCDERGTTEYNLALGERRASAVKMYLIDLGISGSRLSAISYGEEQPIETGGSEGAYQKNRRAHFSIQ